MPYERGDTWKSMGFKALGEFLATKRTELKTFFDEHKKDDGFDMTPEEIVDARTRNDELTDATKKWEEQRVLDSTFQKNVEEMRRLNEPDYKIPHGGGNGNNGNGNHEPAVKSFAEMFAEDAGYKAVAARKHNKMDQYTIELPGVSLPDVKASVITTAAGYAPFSPRSPRVVDFALRRPVVADLIPTDNTTLTQIIYMEETTFENNADTVAEGVGKVQSDVKWTQRTENVRKIATYLVVTDEQLDDVPGFQSTLERRGTVMLQLAEEVQLLNGDGSAPDLMGFYNKPSTQSQSATGFQNQDAFYLAMTKVRHIGFAEPTGHVIHPDNWTPIRLLKTLDGQYIWGSPMEAGPERLWGKPVIVTTAATANTGLTGDFQLYSHISRRMGITIIVGYVNDDMIKNQRTVVIEMRESLEIYRAAAFCLVPNLGTSIA